MTWLFPSPHLGWVYTAALFLSNPTSTLMKLGLKPLLGSCAVWVFSIVRRCPACYNIGGLSSVISLEDLVSLKSCTVLCTDQTLIIHSVDDLGKLLHLVWSLSFQSQASRPTKGITQESTTQRLRSHTPVCHSHMRLFNQPCLIRIVAQYLHRMKVCYLGRVVRGSRVSRWFGA